MNNTVHASLIAILGLGSSARLAIAPAPQDDMPAGSGIAVSQGASPAARATLEDEYLAACRNCHKDQLSLGEIEADELRERIEAIIRRESEHVVPIAPLSDEDLDALAAALGAPPRSGAQD